MKTLRDYLKREPKIGYFTNFLNEKDGLENHHTKMSKYDFDARIYVDGKYPGFNYKGVASNDGSLDIIKKIPNSILISPKTEIAEMDKNNLAFEKAGELGIDLLLQIDADEWVDFDRETLLESFVDNFESVGTFQFMTRFTNHYSSPPRIVYQLPRLFFKPEFIRCEKIHWWFYAFGNRITCDQTSFIEGAHIHHDDRVRSIERNKLMDEYQEENIEREKKIMHYENGEKRMIVETHKCSFDPKFMMGKKCIICRDGKN